VSLRLTALALALACSSPGARPNGRPVVPTTVLEGPGSGSGAAPVSLDAGAGNYVSGPGEFPVPADARPVESSTDAHDFTFEMPRAQEPVVAELKRNLAALGFSIEDEYVAPAGSMHWVITRGAKVYKVSVAGQLMRSLLIVTVE
jgi:hypothetical protein